MFRVEAGKLGEALFKDSYRETFGEDKGRLGKMTIPPTLRIIEKTKWMSTI